MTQGIHDKFIEALAARVKALKVGDALAADTQMGPLASQAQLETTLSYIDIATKEGGRKVVGGEVLEARRTRLLRFARADRGHAAGHAHQLRGGLRPGGVHACASRITTKRWPSANAGEFGLSAGIMTSSLKYARHFVRNVRAGMVMTNLPTAGVDYHVPFGGTRKSSYGPREQGFAAVEFYTQVKTSYTWA